MTIESGFIVGGLIVVAYLLGMGSGRLGRSSSVPSITLPHGDPLQPGKYVVLFNDAMLSMSAMQVLIDWGHTRGIDFCVIATGDLDRTLRIGVAPIERLTDA